MLPSQIDLSKSLLPVQDQGQLNASAAFAALACMEQNKRSIKLSRDFIYYHVKTTKQPKDLLL